MSRAVQAKFLRVLQEREFQRLGGTRTLRTDARFIAASNRDLRRMVAQGEFRDDLFYRLHVFELHLPPLRERPDDILPLCEVFLEEIGRGLGRPPAGLSRDARPLLVEYPWPGNVRELRNALERASILADGGLITREHLNALSPPDEEDAAPTRSTAELGVMPSAERPPRPAASSPSPGWPSSTRAWTSAAGTPMSDLATAERSLIETALVRARYNKARAARDLGLTRTQLYVRLRRYGL